MADSTHGHGEHHHGPTLKTYMVIAVALAVFTLVSFVVNAFVRGGALSPAAGFTIILAVAVVKATLVGMYFMHLIVDWGKLYYFIIPAFILGAMMMVVLLPDIVLGWKTTFPPPLTNTK
jgi:cytochrome c oxidase subunit IV